MKKNLSALILLLMTLYSYSSEYPFLGEHVTEEVVYQAQFKDDSTFEKDELVIFLNRPTDTYEFGVIITDVDESGTLLVQVDNYPITQVPSYIKLLGKLSPEIKSMLLQDNAIQYAVVGKNVPQEVINSAEFYNGRHFPKNELVIVPHYDKQRRNF